MKKVLFTVLVAGMSMFYACGPSAQEKADALKATQDSIANAVQQQTAATIAAGDSTMKAMGDSAKMKMETPEKK